MQETKETSLIVKNDSLWDRLKEFFRMFFGTNGKYTLNSSSLEKDENNLNKQNIENNVVKNNLNNIENTNYESKLHEILLELQDAFENGIIKEEELTKEQKEDLKRLYIIQINALKNSIDEDEKIIYNLKEKIDNKKENNENKK